MGKEREGVSIVVSWPEPGRVLPALTRRLGADVAAELAEAFLDDFLETVHQLPVDVFLLPLDQPAKFRAKYPRLEIRPAPSPYETFRMMLGVHRRALAVTAPPPDLHPRLLWSAFEMMSARDAVLGATDRGDPWLVGLARLRDVFRGVRWNGAGALERLEDNLEDAGLVAGWFPGRRSVEDLPGLEAMVRRAGPDRAKRTRRIIRKLAKARHASTRAKA